MSQLLENIKNLQHSPAPTLSISAPRLRLRILPEVFRSYTDPAGLESVGLAKAHDEMKQDVLQRSELSSDKLRAWLVHDPVSWNSPITWVPVQGIDWPSGQAWIEGPASWPCTPLGEMLGKLSRHETTEEIRNSSEEEIRKARH